MADFTHLTRVRLPHADIPDSDTTPTIVLPAGRRLPRGVQGLLALANRRIALQILRRRYGSAFLLDLPIFGRVVVLSDPSHGHRIEHLRRCPR